MSALRAYRQWFSTAQDPLLIFQTCFAVYFYSTMQKYQEIVRNLTTLCAYFVAWNCMWDLSLLGKFPSGTCYPFSLSFSNITVPSGLSDHYPLRKDSNGAHNSICNTFIQFKEFAHRSTSMTTINSKTTISGKLTCKHQSETVLLLIFIFLTKSPRKLLTPL